MPENHSHSILEYFGKSILLNEEEKNLIKKSFQYKLYKKRRHLLLEGDVSAYKYFVVRGCLRSYTIDDKGSEHILQFAPENNWINDMASFYECKPSSLNIDAMEDTVVLQINRGDLLMLFDKIPKLDRFFRIMMQKAFINLQERIIKNIGSTAEGRYSNFLERYPHLASRIPQTQIAAYLGISPEFLSRLKNVRTKQNNT